MTNTMEETVYKNPTWWKRRSALERGLTVFAVFGVFLCIALAIGIAVVNSISRPYNSELECRTPSCIHTASKVLLNMDVDVEPCDDFYRFACGGFLKNTIIPDDKTGVGIFSIIGDKVQEQLRVSIEEPITPNEPEPFRLVKNLYKACMNKTAIEKKGLTPMLKILKQLGGWPVLEGDQWDDSEFNWIETIVKLRRMGYSVDHFMDFSIVIDLKNNTKQVIDLDQADLGLSREYLSNGAEDKIVKAYSSFMIDIAVILGADRVRAEKELSESLNFEMKLANISLPSEERRNISLLYNPMTIKELTDVYPSIPWKEYFNQLLSPKIQVDDDEIVNVNVPSYISNFVKLMDKTEKRVQANYVMWRVTFDSLTFLNDEVRNRQLMYSTIKSGRTERESRWKECVDIVSESLSISVGALYIRKYFNKDAKNNAMEIVTDIRNQFNQMLKGVKWMDDETKKNALEKAESISTHIAYPDELLDDSKLEGLYRNLEVSENDYLHSILNLSSFGTEYSFSKLREPVNKSDWVDHGDTSVVNAFYSSSENSIIFPAGILQGAFFSNDRPRYMNYGAMGYVIGHEITHGFDDQGRQFDKEGNLVDWWAPSTKQKYLEKAECIINQYGNYTVPEVKLNLNGINTQGENIADNGGIKEAYLAYKAWSSRNSPEPRLPGLERFSPRQMFWISAANVYCSKFRPEAMKAYITTGVHSLGEFRILGTFSNMPEFAEDFNCPVGSKMNPRDKCAVW